MTVSAHRTIITRIYMIRGRDSRGHNGKNVDINFKHPFIPTLSGGSLTMPPQSPPIHREHRRLRKKARLLQPL